MSQKKNPSIETHVKDILSEYPDTKTCWLAYSGGLDSHVLLHVLAGIKNKIKPELIAVHINHGISQHAGAWQKHCQNICENYSIRFRSFAVDLSHKNGKGQEALARDKRYEIFSQLMMKNDLLLTAHHLNDQAETVLLQLLRGTGPDGLAGILQSRDFSDGFLVRPLIEYDREELHGYALQESLDWIEDESNSSNKHDRNFLRNKIMPELLKKWPGALKTFSRASQHQADASSLIKEISEKDLVGVCNNDYKKLNIIEVGKLSSNRRKNVFRAWVKKNNMNIPGAQIIKRIEDEVISAGLNRNPCLKWKGAEIRRYQGFLHIMRPQLPHDSNIRYVWDFDEALELASGYLTAAPVCGFGISRDSILDNKVEVRFRQGGEALSLSNRRHRTKLKKILQEKGIPPWQRDRLPLIFYENELIAVVGLWIDHDYAASADEPAWNLEWRWQDD